MLDSTGLVQGFPVPLPTKRIENNCRQDIHGRNKQSKHASNTFPNHTPPTAAKTTQRKSREKETGQKEDFWELSICSAFRSKACFAIATKKQVKHLPVAPHGEGVLALPGLSAASLGVVVAVALVETAGSLAGGGKAASLAVLVDGVDDPVDAGIDADGLVLRVDHDDLVVLVGGVLVDPVRVEDAQVSATAADTLLGGGLERALVLQLVHTHVGGLACRQNFG